MKIVPFLPSFCTGVLFLTAALSPASGLDLTPAQSFRELEGMKIPIVQFDDAGKKITYQPPAHWRVNGDKSLLHLYAPGEGQGWMKIMRVEKKPGPRPTAEMSPEEWRSFARQAIPKGAEEIALSRETASPFTLEGQPSREFVFSYLQFASREMASVSIVDRDETQWLIVLISAKKDEFETIHAQGISSLFSWRKLP